MQLLTYYQETNTSAKDPKHIALLKTIPMIVKNNTSINAYPFIVQFLTKQKITEWDNELAYIFYQHAPQQFSTFICSQLLKEKTNPDYILKIKQKLQNINIIRPLTNKLNLFENTELDTAYLHNIFKNNNDSSTWLLKKLKHIAHDNKEDYLKYILTTSAELQVLNEAKRQMAEFLYQQLINNIIDNKTLKEKILLYQVQEPLNNIISVFLNKIEQNTSNNHFFNNTNTQQWRIILNFLAFNNKENNSVLKKHLHTLTQWSSTIAKELNEDIISNYKEKNKALYRF